MKNKNKITIFITIAILIATIILSQLIIKTSPKAKKSEPKEEIAIVTTTTIPQGSHQVLIETTGRVQASKETKLSAEVGGTIVYVSPDLKPGAIVKSGDILFRIDKTNYQAALLQSEAALKNAQAQRALELGQQEIAKKDLQISGRKLTQQQKSLALREPQLAIVEAQIKDANSRIIKAKRDLERTTIKAPYDGIIADVPLSQGTTVTIGMTLATIVNNETLWIFAEVDANLLEYISFSSDDSNGSMAKIKPLTSTSDNYFEAYAMSLLPKSQSGSKRPVVLFEVHIPQNKRQTIFDGDLVSIAIQGNPIHESFLLPWNLLKNDRFVWIYEDQKLKIKEIEILFKHKDHVIIKGISKDTEIITSNLSNPQEGQKLKKVSDE